jgi:xylulokinase
MTLVAGVDSSTQSCKVVIVDVATGRVVREGRAVHPPGTEVPPDAWWVALKDAIADAGGFGDVESVSIAGQQHGMVVLDAEGRVIRDALLWNDTRSASAARDLIDEVGAGQYARRTGVVPVASFTATKLRWLRDAEPENAARVAAVALPHDWLTWRLRGFGPAGESPRGPVLTELTTDRSDASGTAYWGAAGYDEELFVRALGHDAVRPRVLGPGEVAGRTPDGVLVGPATTPARRSDWVPRPEMSSSRSARPAPCSPSRISRWRMRPARSRASPMPPEATCRLWPP